MVPLHNVTVKQILSGGMRANDNSILINFHKMKKLCLLGSVVSISIDDQDNTKVYTTIKLNDWSGTITVKYVYDDTNDAFLSVQNKLESVQYV